MHARHYQLSLRMRRCHLHTGRRRTRRHACLPYRQQLLQRPIECSGLRNLALCLPRVGAWHLADTGMHHLNSAARGHRRHPDRVRGLHLWLLRLRHLLVRLHHWLLYLRHLLGTYGKSEAAARHWHWRQMSLRWQCCLQGLMDTGGIGDRGRRHCKGQAATHHLRHHLESWSRHGRSANERRRLRLAARGSRIGARSLDHARTKLVDGAADVHPQTCILWLHHNCLWHCL